MGEYGKYLNREIKLGTCESMYYIRYSQRGLIAPLPNSLNIQDDSILSHIRFRFPWPDEDSLEPGDYENFGRTELIPNSKSPKDADHGAASFSMGKGYFLRGPCPCSGAAYSANGEELEVRLRSGDPEGDLELMQQAVRGGTLCIAVLCRACGECWSLGKEGAEESVCAPLEKEIERLRPLASERGAFWSEVLRRIRAGYEQRF